MTSFSHDPLEHDAVPAWIADGLRAPVPSRADARARIMQQVYAMPAPRRVGAPLVQRTARWRRRGSLTGLGGVLLTALLMVASGVREGDRQAMAARVQPMAVVLGDSAVPVRGADSLAAIMSGRLLDTMKVVEYMVRGTDVRSVRVQRAVRDPRAVEAHEVPFEPTTLTRVSGTEWRVRALVPRNAKAVAFTVNDVSLDPTPLQVASTEL